MCNVFNQFIISILTSSKIVISVESGKVITQFLNVSLACDYRIIADNTIYEKPYLELGIPPKGGGIFFLTKMFGPSKAYKIVFSDKDITANDALKLGLVDEVVPLEELEESALSAAREFARRPARLLAAVKRLSNYSMKEFNRFLELENEEIVRIINSSDFRKEVSPQGG